MSDNQKIDGNIIVLLKANLKNRAIEHAKKNLNLSPIDAIAYVNNLQSENNIITTERIVDPATKKRSIIAMLITFGIFGFIIFKLATCGDSSTSNNQPKAITDHHSMAYVMTIEYAKQRIKYPEEASFDWTPTVDQVNSGGIYHETGYVKSKNGFGVKVKIYFDCYIQFTGGDDNQPTSWQLISLNME